MAKATKTYVLPDGKADKNLEIAIAQIEKEFGNGAIMRLGDDKRVSIPTISTGVPSSCAQASLEIPQSNPSRNGKQAPCQCPSTCSRSTRITMGAYWSPT